MNYKPKTILIVIVAVILCSGIAVSAQSIQNYFYGNDGPLFSGTSPYRILKRSGTEIIPVIAGDDICLSAGTNCLSTAGSGSGGGSSIWSTSTPNLYYNNSTRALLYGASATTSDAKVEIIGDTMFNGGTMKIGTTSDPVAYRGLYVATSSAFGKNTLSGGNSGMVNVELRGNDPFVQAMKLVADRDGLAVEYGFNGTATGANTKNVGLYGWASEATTNLGLWVNSGDTQLDGGLTVSGTSSFGIIDTGTWSGTSISDAYIDNNITASNYVRKSTWTDIDNYPAACSAGDYVSALGDTLTCSTPTNTTYTANNPLTLTGTAFGIESASTTLWETDTNTTYTGGTNLTLVGTTFNVDNPIVANLTGNADTATALAANGSNCPAGQYPLGVDTLGAVESCTADTNTTYTAGGTLLNLTGTVFSLNEGTLTDTKLCTYEAATGLNCDHTDANTTYTAGTGLTLTTGAFSVNTSQNIATLSNLTSNGFVKTSGGTGALSIDTNGYVLTTDLMSTTTNLTIADMPALTRPFGFGAISTSTLDTTGNFLVAGATSTVKLMNIPYPLTISEIGYDVSAGTAGINVGDCTNYMGYKSVSTTFASSTVSTNNTFTQGEDLCIDVNLSAANSLLYLTGLLTTN